MRTTQLLPALSLVLVLMAYAPAANAQSSSIALMYNFTNYPVSGGTFVDWSGTGGFNSAYFGNAYPWQATAIGYDFSGPSAPLYGFTGSLVTLGDTISSDQSAQTSSGTPADPSPFWTPMMTFAVTGVTTSGGSFESGGYYEVTVHNPDPLGYAITSMGLTAHTLAIGTEHYLAEYSTDGTTFTSLGEQWVPSATTAQAGGRYSVSTTYNTNVTAADSTFRIYMDNTNIDSSAPTWQREEFIATQLYFKVAAVPEPSSALLCMLGAATLLRRRRASAQR